MFNNNLNRYENNYKQEYNMKHGKRIKNNGNNGKSAQFNNNKHNSNINMHRYQKS